MNPFLIILAILPGLLICYGIYAIDKYHKEPFLYIIVSFVLGMACTFPAMLIESHAASTLGIESSSGSFGLLLLDAFIIVALNEEFMKFLCLILYPFPRKVFNEPLDGIVYAVVIGMGFATLENVLYAERFGLETSVLRAFTAVPAHAVFAIFMGYYVGLAKFDKAKKIKLILTGLLLAVSVHGIYDFLILQEYYEWLMLLATLALYASIFLAVKLIRLHQQISPFKEHTSQDQMDSNTPDILSTPPEKYESEIENTPQENQIDPNVDPSDDISDTSNDKS